MGRLFLRLCSDSDGDPMSALPDSFRRAERRFDRLEPVTRIVPEFTESTINAFIRDFASCGNDPADWLYGEGVKGEWDGSGQDDVARFLQSVCTASVAGFEHPAYGAPFYQLMKRMALDRFESEQENVD